MSFSSLAIADSGMMAEHVVPAAATRAVDQSLRQVVLVLLFPGITAMPWIDVQDVKAGGRTARDTNEACDRRAREQGADLLGIGGGIETAASAVHLRDGRSLAGGTGKNGQSPRG